MPHYTCDFVEVTKFLEAGELPERALRRLGDQVWVVRQQPYKFDEESKEGDWSLIRYGDLVRIPLIPYRSMDTDPAKLIVGMLDMATRCVLDYPKPLRVHWVVGQPVEDLRPTTEAFRTWVGLAIQLH